jgi:hypothetical protein
MPRCWLDHMAIVAPSLAVGVDYVRQALGVTPQAGGEHPRMGTHNCLLKLGDRLYLEVIAVNPAAPRPVRARWFELDEPDPAQPVRLAAWIARTDDIRRAAAASPVPLGEVEAMSRGTMNWLITVPKDGKLPLGGIAPALIQWPEGIHPAPSLQESGCSLVRLEGFHPDPATVNSVLASIGFEGDFRVSALPAGGQPHLVAHIGTPNGLRQLRSPAVPREGRGAA